MVRRRALDRHETTIVNSSDGATNNVPWKTVIFPLMSLYELSAFLEIHDVENDMDTEANRSRAMTRKSHSASNEAQRKGLTAAKKSPTLKRKPIDPEVMSATTEQRWKENQRKQENESNSSWGCQSDIPMKDKSKDVHSNEQSGEQLRWGYLRSALCQS